MEEYDFSLEEIYGLPLEEYCRRLGRTPEGLIREAEENIRILEEAARRIAALPDTEKTRRVLALRLRIDATIAKKRENVARWRRWTADNANKSHETRVA